MINDLVPANYYDKNIKIYPSVFRLGGHLYPLLVRQGVAQKLANIASKLPNKYKLLAVSGYRDINTQQMLWNNWLAKNKLLYPDETKEQIYERTLKLVCDPSKQVPPHSTGGAIDVFLLDNVNNKVTMYEPLTTYYEEPLLYSDKISRLAQEQRILLNRLMLSEGFAPNPDEYWHFSYGHTSWEKYYNKKQIYDEIVLKDIKMYNFLTTFTIRIVRKTLALLHITEPMLK